MSRQTQPAGEGVRATWRELEEKDLSADSEDLMREQWLEEAVPVITRLPFSVDTTHNFDAWVVEHLSAENSSRKP